MRRIARGARYTIEILITGIAHYWVTLALGLALQAAAVMMAAAERGYYALGSEMCILPMVFMIGYYLTPTMKIEISEKGLRIRTKRRRA